MTHFFPFSKDTWEVLSFLALGMDGGIPVTLMASKRGLTIKLRGFISVTGKTPVEALEKFKAAHVEVMAEIEKIKAEQKSR